MGSEQELAAVAGRKHRRPDACPAVYALPGAAATVRILPIVGATRRDRFVVVINRDGRAVHTRPCGTAVEAVLL